MGQVMEDENHVKLSSYCFLNRQLILMYNTKVTLQFKPLTVSDEDEDDDPVNSYELILNDTGRHIHVHGLDSKWLNPSKDPHKIDWGKLDLSITPSESPEFGLQRWITFSLYGMESVPYLKTQTPQLHARLFQKSDDKGFLSLQSPVLQEFKRRFSIESAADRLKKAQKTLDKHLAIAPFVTD